MQIGSSGVRAAELKGLHARAESFAEGFQDLVTQETPGHIVAVIASGTTATSAQGHSTVKAKSPRIQYYCMVSSGPHISLSTV